MYSSIDFRLFVGFTLLLSVSGLAAQKNTTPVKPENSGKAVEEPVSLKKKLTEDNFQTKIYLGLFYDLRFVFDHAGSINASSQARIDGFGLWALWHFRRRAMLSVDFSICNLWLCTGLRSLSANGVDLGFIDQTYYPLKMLLYYLPIRGFDRFALGGGFEMFFAGRRKINNNFESGSESTDIFIQVASLYRQPVIAGLGALFQFSVGLNLTPGADQVVSVFSQQTWHFQFMAGLVYRVL